MIAAIENAMLERLRVAGANGTLGYRYKTLDSYPEDWDQWLKEKGQWEAPAAWVVFAGTRAAEQTDGLSVRWPANFFLVVASENARNETARRHGGKKADGTPAEGEPGSYQMMLDAVGLIGKSHLGLDIDILEVGAARLVRTPPQLQARNASLYAVEFTTTFTVPLVTDTNDEAAPFTDFHVNWDVQPFGNVDGDAGEAGVQIPADDTADATDHVELPQ